MGVMATAVSLDATWRQLPDTCRCGMVMTVALAALGAVWVFCLVTRVLHGIWVTFLRPGHNLVRRYGDWAIVTGATDGIGKAYVRQLARLKINVVAVSRAEEKLRDLAKEVEGSFPVEVRTVAVDFTTPDLAGSLTAVEKAVSDIEVGILVNNVGLSYPFAQYLHELNVQTAMDIIKVNVEGTTRMTHLALPGMLKRKRGAIVNIGSGAATVLPSDPLYSVYAGTKGFVDHFSRTLYAEYKHHGIDVQCQAPLYVTTKLSKIRQSSLFIPTPDTFAKFGVKWIGYEPRCTPYWVHAIMWCVISMLPEGWMDSIRLKQSLAIRKRALLKEKMKKGE
ncbi:hypothetical protein CBR_g33 [Chara braunii]|uniref:Very-long-chain 3-oxoacyl-CoA reductase n=1 Tax=Chara braunii TaxID=69332 RepID=A0A388JLK5_CHABU|nr:hypothetical protein CBR_g33 [Chara braunii]|eukprot:GBG58633.1 hypothetical protein CBR_g33 [Chara braunii]